MRDLVISCMANATIPSGSKFKARPAILHWMPAAPGPGHPSWTKDADALRAAPWRKGRLLPALVHRFRQSLGFDWPEVGRLAAIGFSAGANNGLRELLRNDEDRERFDAVFSIDGLHPNLKPIPDWDSCQGPFAAWSAEMEPVADFATAAAMGERLAVFTSSEVASPAIGVVASTREALGRLLCEVKDRLGTKTGPLLMPVPFPSDPLDPKPIAEWGSRGLYVLGYAGNDKAAHIRQGTQVVRDVWRDFLAPYWTEGKILVDFNPEPEQTAPLAAGASSYYPKSKIGALLVGASMMAGGCAGVFAR